MLKYDDDRKRADEQRRHEEARALRVQLARQTAAIMRKDAAEILVGAANESDTAKCEARLAVGNELIRSAMKFERGDLTRGD
jgi:hypothetical protein